MKRVALLAFAALAGAGVAHAQSLTDSVKQGVSPVVMPKDNGRKPSTPPPKALPGSRAEPTAVAPAGKDALDLPPTEALFDAINRGDLAGAKDAVNRGADIRGHNVLGLTPIEQSVDLGRNEITFLLLSLRGTTSASDGTKAPSPASARQLAQQARAEKAAEAKVARESAGARARAVAEAARQPPRQARLFAGDGGTPAPQAGFLGFGSR